MGRGQSRADDERRLRALEMRDARATHPEIARALGGTADGWRGVLHRMRREYAKSEEADG